MTDTPTNVPDQPASSSQAKTTEIARTFRTGSLNPLAIAPEAAAPAAKEFALFKLGEADDVLSLIQENLGGAGIEFSSLVGVSWPTGTQLNWNIDTAEGPKAMKEFEAVILRYRDGRLLWGSSYSESSGDPPVCVSTDMKIGVGMPGGDCSVCPLAQWGSDRNDAGQPTRGKACQERRRLFMIVPWSLLPIWVSVPPTSLKPIKQYFAKLVGLGLPYYSVVSKLRLKKETNKDGTDYAELEIEMKARLQSNEIAFFRALAKEFDGAFNVQAVVPPVKPEPKPSSGGN